MAKDPRIGGSTVNEILQDLAIRHGVSLERLKSSEVRKLLNILAEADRDALDKLEARLDRLGPVELQRFGFGQATTERLIKVREAIEEISEKSYEIIFGFMTQTMLSVAREEVEFQTQAVRASLIDVETDWIRPSNTTLKTLVRARPFAGKLLKEYASEWSRGKRERVTAAIRTAIINGQTVREARKEVAKILDNANEIGADRIARTAIAHISNASRQATYDENAEVIKGVKWVATLDSRTCPECGSLDGKVYPVGAGRRPPAHLSCRCTTVPVIKGRQALIDAGLLKKGSRASADGQVPDDVTFADWLKKRSAKEQEDVLGKTRAEMFRNGKITLDGFVDKSGREFNLSELRSRNKAAFEIASASPAATLGALHEQAKFQVLETGRKTRVEHLIAIDEDSGAILSELRGTKKEVRFDDVLNAETLKDGRSIVIHHNHPSSSSLSMADVLMAMRPGVSGIWAHGHDGSSYFVSKEIGALSEKALKTFQDKVFNEMRQYVRDGRLSPANAGQIFNHFVWKSMANKGRLQYRATLEGGSAKLYDELFDVLNAIEALL